MKQSFLLSLLSFTTFLNAYDLDYLSQKLPSKTVEAAMHVYNQEIEQFENEYLLRENHLSRLISMYIERANLHFSKKDFHSALTDYRKAISHIEDANLDAPSDLLEGICGCLFCYQCLDEDESAKQEFNKLVYHVALIGEDIEKVDWFKNSPIYSIYKNHSHGSKVRLNKLPDMTPQEFCEFQCSGYAVAAASACLKVSNPTIAAICGGCIWGLERLCSLCCKGDGFWENCVKPLRRLFHDPWHPENPEPSPYE